MSQNRESEVVSSGRGEGEGDEELDWLSEGLGMEWWTGEEGGLNEGQEGVGRGIEGVI